MIYGSVHTWWLLDALRHAAFPSVLVNGIGKRVCDRCQLVGLQFPDHIVVGLLQYRQIFETERAEIVSARRSPFSSIDNGDRKSPRGGGTTGTSAKTFVRNLIGVGDGDLVIVMEQLGNCTAGIEIVGRFRICDLGDESCLCRCDFVPVNTLEEGMVLDFFGTVGPKTLVGIESH